MQELHLFEYAVIRIVPKVEREEFINTGMILYARKPRFLGVKIELHQDKLACIAPELDVAVIQQYLNAFEAVAQGKKEGGAIACLEAASRFRWLTASRSTVIQTSKVHPGFCSDPEQKLTQLFEQLVL